MTVEARRGSKSASSSSGSSKGTLKGFKERLPTKDCATCGRPFSWRKKWARSWDEVKYCSDRCRGEAKKATRSATDD